MLHMCQCQKVEPGLAYTDTHLFVSQTVFAAGNAGTGGAAVEQTQLGAAAAPAARNFGRGPGQQHPLLQTAGTGSSAVTQRSLTAAMMPPAMPGAVMMPPQPMALQPAAFTTQPSATAAQWPVAAFPPQLAPTAANGYYPLLLRYANGLNTHRQLERLMTAASAWAFNLRTAGRVSRECSPGNPCCNSAGLTQVCCCTCHCTKTSP